jgi:hypothetical protein
MVGLDANEALDKITAMIDGDDPFPSREGFEEIRGVLRETGRTVGSPGPEPVDPEPSGV